MPEEKKESNQESNNIELNQQSNTLDSFSNELWIDIATPEPINLNIIGEEIEDTQTNSEKIDFGNYSVKKDTTAILIRHSYRKLFVLSFFSMILFTLSTIVLFIYNSYLEDVKAWNVESKYEKYINKYKVQKEKIFSYLWKSTVNHIPSIDMSSQTWLKTLDTFLKDERFWYLQKRDTIETNIANLINSIFPLISSVKDQKDYVSKYGFFTQELKNLLEDQDSMSNIKRSLLSLENIKFSSAIEVFSYLDTFIDGLAKSIAMEKDEITQLMKDIINKGENDVLLYLNNCYLNPFEISYDCNTIWDFNTYYKITENTDLDINFFKKLMYYIDLKIEQTDIPSFSILFNGFNSNSKQISFNINVDTFKQDELALIEKGIPNPHVFIVKNLINFLKQSKFIIWEDITAKNIQIQPRVITIWSNQFNVNHSTMSFSLPIQRALEREIFDFVEANMYRNITSQQGETENEERTWWTWFTQNTWEMLPQSTGIVQTGANQSTGVNTPSTWSLQSTWKVLPQSTGIVQTGANQSTGVNTPSTWSLQSTWKVLPQSTGTVQIGAKPNNTINTNTDDDFLIVN
jgi:hypothetical protein